MFGAHLSIAGGMHNALLAAEKYGFDTVQVFTKNQKQWRCKPLDPCDVNEWAGHCRRLKFKRTVSHSRIQVCIVALTNYLTAVCSTSAKPPAPRPSERLGLRSEAASGAQVALVSYLESV